MAVVMDITQSGSGSTQISAQPGDTVTLELAETPESGVLNMVVAAMQALTNITGVKFAFNDTGGAS